MKTIEEIKSIFNKHKRELQEKYQILKIGIFGSYVRGEYREGSDIDLLVEFEEPVSLLKLVKAENHLSELLDMRVDLVPKKDVRPELKQTILKETVYL